MLVIGRIKTRNWVVAIALSIAPFAIASLPLIWFGSPRGVEWAYSLFNQDHPLNFGGNPSEVLSHLLNWILMSGCTAGLCSVVIATSLLKVDIPSQSNVACVPGAVFGLSVIFLLGWTGYLDSHHGEGVVVLSFVLCFGPGTVLSACAALRLLTSRATFLACFLHVTAVFVLSVGFQWVYEHSGTGGPNLLVYPLLFGQVCAWWLIGTRLVNRYPITPRPRDVSSPDQMGR